MSLSYFQTKKKHFMEQSHQILCSLGFITNATLSHVFPDGFLHKYFHDLLLGLFAKCFRLKRYYLRRVNGRNKKEDVQKL